ncbi:MAG: hypothetical protein U5K43_05075 [Halofilum sp. (in: g-proteobacteria)]|nr:hypothetical protein [Halofilum sp. (in: g-proteobacteria)]
MDERERWIGSRRGRDLGHGTEPRGCDTRPSRLPATRDLPYGTFDGDDCSPDFDLGATSWSTPTADRPASPRENRLAIRW